MKIMSKLSIIMAVVFGLILTSCNKQDPEMSNEDKKESTDAVTSSNAFEESVVMVEQAEATLAIGSYVSPGGCATVTYDSLSNPKTITIDFGSTNCLCIDGRNRRGSITASWTGTFMAIGSTVSVSFGSYAVNDNQINGTNSIAYNGSDVNGNWSATLVTNGTIVLADAAGSVTWNANITRVQIAGASTSNLNDDKFAISGTASGSASTGKSFDATITTPLVRDYSCIEHFTQGTIVFDTGIGPDKTLNFGIGGCDNQVTVSIAGIDYILYL